MCIHSAGQVLTKFQTFSSGVSRMIKQLTTLYNYSRISDWRLSRVESSGKTTPWASSLPIIPLVLVWATELWNGAEVGTFTESRVETYFSRSTFFLYMHRAASINFWPETFQISHTWKQVYEAGVYLAPFDNVFQQQLTGPSRVTHPTPTGQAKARSEQLLCAHAITHGENFPTGWFFQANRSRSSLKSHNFKHIRPLQSQRIDNIS